MCNLLLCVPGTGWGPRQSRGSGAGDLSARGAPRSTQQQRLQMFYHRKLFYYATQFLGERARPSLHHPPPRHWATLAQKDLHKLQTITTTVRPQDPPPPAPRHKVPLLRCGNRMGNRDFSQQQIFSESPLNSPPLYSTLNNSFLPSNNVYRYFTE